MRYFNKNRDTANAQQNGKETENENESVQWEWQWQDGAEWVAYAAEVSDAMENAWQRGEDTIDVTKQDTMFEIRFEHNLECHIASNRMRPIRRVRVNGAHSEQGMDAADSCADGFDALSNRLEGDSVFGAEEEKDGDAQIGTFKDSERALNEYGDDYVEYMRKFQSLDGHEKDEQRARD